MAQEIPVYLFTGFLDSGKTKFIQETFEDERFNSGENTLLLVCEEGEEEYDPSLFVHNCVYIQVIHAPEELTPQYLEKLRKECAEWAESEEDVLSYALFPQVAAKFLEQKYNPQKAAPAPQKASANADNGGVRTLYVEDLSI